MEWLNKWLERLYQTFIVADRYKTLIGGLEKAADEDRIEQMNQANPDYIIRDLRDLISICKEKRTWNDTSIW